MSKELVNTFSNHSLHNSIDHLSTFPSFLRLEDYSEPPVPRENRNFADEIRTQTKDPPPFLFESRLTLSKSSSIRDCAARGHG